MELKYLALVKYAHSGSWFILDDYDSEGVNLGTKIFEDESEAEDIAREVIAFDPENGKPERGVNYQVTDIYLTNNGSSKK